MSKIKAVIFDFDDTLVLTKPIRFAAMKDAGKTFYDKDINDEDIEKHWGKSFPIMIKAIIQHEAPAEEMVEKYLSILHKYPLKSYPQAAQTLKLLSNNYLLGLMTSSIKQFVTEGFKDAQLDLKLFDHIQTAEDTNVHKPNPEVFLPSLNYFAQKNIQKDEIIYVGDSESDHQAATNAGINFVAIAENTTPKEKFTALQANYISSLSELPEYIKS